MNPIPAILAFFVAGAAWAAPAAIDPSRLDCRKALLLRIEGREIRLCEQAAGGYLVSPECASASENAPCPAVAAAARADRKPGDLPDGLRLVNSPMAGCLRRGGKVAMARDARYNQYCLCAFDGPSFVSCEAFPERD